MESLRFEDVVFRHKTAEQNAIDGISFKGQRWRVPKAFKGKLVAVATNDTDGLYDERNISLGLIAGVLCYLLCLV